jgi:2-haloalkanoic acid dehalogenase type II
MKPWDILTFDCYGTLIDWDRGITEAFRAALAASGVTLPLDQVLAAYHQIEPAVQAEPFRRYRDVLTEAVRRVAARLDWRLPESRTSFLADSLPSWTPFVDTNHALERLAGAGCRLGILSNTDDDLLAATRRHFTVPFEAGLIITAQQVKSYKPAATHFETARARIAGGRWLHVAQSHFHDIAPAGRLGIPSAWINRTGERPRGPGAALTEVRTLGEFASWMVD